MKRPRTSEAILGDALVTLLSHDLTPISENILAIIESRIRNVRQRREQSDHSAPTTPSAPTSSPTTPSPTPPASNTGFTSDNPPAGPALAYEVPDGLFAKFIFGLLIGLPTIREFLSQTSGDIVKQVLKPVDGRVAILRKSDLQSSLSLTHLDKYERLLSDRSLATEFDSSSYTVVAKFASSLWQSSARDTTLIGNSVLRGRVWLALEKEFGNVGISAVVCFEHSTFKKAVKQGEMANFVKYLRYPQFEDIVTLAEEASDGLKEAQRAFDKRINAHLHHEKGVILDSTTQPHASHGHEERDTRLHELALATSTPNGSRDDSNSGTTTDDGSVPIRSTQQYSHHPISQIPSEDGSAVWNTDTMTRDEGSGGTEYSKLMFGSGGSLGSVYEILDDDPTTWSSTQLMERMLWT
jgi:hypothetical protein